MYIARINEMKLNDSNTKDDLREEVSRGVENEDSRGGSVRE